ncbi:MAG: DUF3443 family protein [Rubrivivax sp.]
MNGVRPSLASLLMLAAVWLTGCGGGGGGGGSGGGNGSVDNVQSIQVAADASRTFVNVVTTSVTICVPGTGNCQTIPNVHVDTGSSGLRLLASAVRLSLPTVTSSSGNRLHTCTAFADGVTWGPVAAADVRLGSQTSATVSIQLIKDGSDGAAVPSNCSDMGTVEDSAALLGSNGVLGVGVFQEDCGGTCVTTPVGMYYACTAAGACSDTTLALATQIKNPVAALPAHNNGVLLQLPAIPANGAVSVTGSLILGIGTSANNMLSGTPITVPASGLRAGYFTASYNGRQLPNSFIDSGSSVHFFDDATIPTCPSNTASGDLSNWYCPGSANALSALNIGVTLTGSNGAATGSSFSVANTQYLFGQAGAVNLWAFSNLGAPAGGSFGASLDLGLPFFYGKTVFTAIEQRSTPYGTGPYFAFQPFP